MLKHNLKSVLFVAMLSCIATFAYADDAAPVYDADNYPPQFDSQADSGGSGGLSIAPDAPASYPPSNPAPSSYPSSNSSSASNYSPPDPSLSLDQRVARAERQIDNLQGKDVSGRMETLQTEVQSLRGQVETLTHQLQQAQTQQRTMYADLDKRVSGKAKADPLAADTTSSAPKQHEIQALRNQVDQLNTQLQQMQAQQKAMLSSLNKQNGVAPKGSSKTQLASASPAPDDTIPAIPAPVSKKPKSKIVPAALPPKTPENATASIDPVSSAPADDAVPAKATDSQPNVAEEQQIYQTAYDLIKQKKYNDAILALQKMLKKYPSGQFAANAHYWLGELYGLLAKNDQSALEFSTVVHNYPDSPKVSDAQLKLGLIFAAQFKWPDAKFAFKKVINHYPGTASARLAAEQLKQIKAAGH